MMTPERLKEIAGRHKRDNSTVAGGHTHAGMVRLILDMSADHSDMLGFIRRIANAGCYVEQAAVGDCFYCGCSLVYDNPHAPGCPAPALEALRKED